ncbi:MAG: wax ester/triacylglycerol synthase family O-acyltransferase [Pseudomonadota bacterium]
MGNALEQMAAVDTAWWHMECEDNPMMVTGVLILDQQVDIHEFRDVIEHRLLSYNRFRQRVIEHDGETFWADDPHFNLDNHLHHIALPDPGDKEALQELVGDLASTPLDLRHPLWQFHLVDHYRDGAAVVARLHHCIADGLALIQVLMSLADQAGTPESNKAPQPATGSSVDSFTASMRRWAGQGAHLGHEWIEGGMDLLRHPENVTHLLEEGRQIAAELAHLGLMPRDPRNHLHADLSGRKSVAWASPLPLARVKDLAHQLRATVNDVLVAAVAGALRLYLSEADRYIMGNVHAVIPFNLRPRDEPVRSLGNRFGLVLVEIPIDEPDVLKRFKRVRQALLEVKESAQPRATFGLLSLLGHGPASLEQFALNTLSDKSSLVLTNVPGPSAPLTIAGARILQPLFWVPQSGHLGVGMSILSYAGTVQFGLIADTSMVHAPNRVVRYFEESFEELFEKGFGSDVRSVG